MPTISFPQSDAQTIDTDYDDGDLTTGAFRKKTTSGGMLGMEVHPEDVKFPKFKSNYASDISANMDFFKDSPSHMALYNRVKNLKPVKKESEPTQTPGQKQTTRLEAPKQTSAAPEPELPIGYSHPVYTDFKPLSENNNSDGAGRIPSVWFDDYIDTKKYANDINSKTPLRKVFAPILDLLYDPADPSWVSLEHLQSFIQPFKEEENLPGMSWGNAVEGWQNYWGGVEEAKLEEMAGGHAKLVEIRTLLEAVVIPHFKKETLYTEFEFDKIQGGEILQTYSVKAFIDPTGSLEIQIDDSHLYESGDPSVRICTTWSAGLKKLADVVVENDNTIDDETIETAVFAFKTHLPDRSLANAFDALIEFPELNPESN